MHWSPAHKVISLFPQPFPTIQTSWDKSRRQKANTLRQVNRHRASGALVATQSSPAPSRSPVAQGLRDAGTCFSHYEPRVCLLQGAECTSQTLRYLCSVAMSLVSLPAPVTHPYSILMMSLCEFQFISSKTASRYKCPSLQQAQAWVLLTKDESPSVLTALFLRAVAL